MFTLQPPRHIPSPPIRVDWAIAALTCFVSFPARYLDLGRDSFRFGVMGAHNRRLCFPSSFTVLACGPLSPISSANATCVPTARRLNAPSSTLFR